ncbi:MAG: hypothetical protein ACRD2J_16085, partial [Thermoanaerobaculia bacterium]
MASFAERERLLAWFRRNRALSRSLFAMIPDASYHARPIPLRHPIVFYDGHFPAFNVNTLAKKGHRRDGVDARFEVLFERGIDPGSEREAAGAAIAAWPSRAEIAAFSEAADAVVEELLAREPLGEAAFTILEHEVMHHETLLYLFHALDPALRDVPPRGIEIPSSISHERRTVRVPAGRATLGATRDEVPFGWDNEFGAVGVDVDSFE